MLAAEAEALEHGGCDRIVEDLGEPADVHRARVGLAARTEGTHHRQAGLHAVADQRGLCGEVVDGVDDEGRLAGEELRSGAGLEELHARLQLRRRLDAQQRVAQHTRLGQAHITPGSDSVTVER